MNLGIIRELNEYDYYIFDKSNCKILRARNFREYYTIEDITKDILKYLTSKNKRHLVGYTIARIFISNDFECAKPWDNLKKFNDYNELNEYLKQNKYNNFKLDNVYSALDDSNIKTKWDKIKTSDCTRFTYE